MRLKRLTKLLLETFDLSKIESYPFKVMGLTTEFKTELDTVRVEFQRLENFEDTIEHLPVLIITDKFVGYNILYSVSDVDTQYRKSGYSYLIKILKTVTDIIIETILKNDQHTDKYQHIYCIGSVSKIGSLSSDDQKDMIYRQIAKNHLPPGYRISEIKFKGVNIDGIAITKTKLR